MTEHSTKQDISFEAWQNPILRPVLELFLQQQEKGLAKYGELVTLNSYSLVEWIEHAQQECVDKLVYLECIKQKAVQISEGIK